jgi:hypothetical protein
MALDEYSPQLDLLTSPDLLRKVDELREKNVGSHVPLPQVKHTLFDSQSQLLTLTIRWWLWAIKVLENHLYCGA